MMAADKTALPWHCEVAGTVAASAEQVFNFLDDPALLTAHMSRSSWTMGGGRMELKLDGGAGRRVGSTMTLTGHAFGLALYLQEVITERNVPSRKVWQTIGTPRLWVIAQYRLGFEIKPQADGSWVRVFIEYALPTSGFSRWLAPPLASGYAKWCTRKMLGDARAHFARPVGNAQVAR
jgi:uncharacterized protein YndB with AHSA1/START domain